MKSDRFFPDWTYLLHFELKKQLFVIENLHKASTSLKIIILRFATTGKSIISEISEGRGSDKQAMELTNHA